ncbi:uncharacterized protein C8R40DRAFT_1178114 [Lentinula edodes]|uniref:uncharacterized protein n=1 Tax=Lentinula edodes TaxID=5353 RepID=UPI001E8D0BE7|nr:uncharacterized protein C8R40DRAFT_1178114 [Lentinula edodes]KAH7868172.1 hypothetical protein C8R40DRAFT_1178114 [Lentinula edodes]
MPGVLLPLQRVIRQPKKTNSTVVVEYEVTRELMPAQVTETPKTNAHFDGAFLEDEEDDEEKRAQSSVGPLKFGD